QQKLQRRLATIVLPAIERLSAAGCGKRPFADDRELRACIALARLARILFCLKIEPPDEPPRLIHPDISDEQAARLLDVVTGKCVGDEAQRILNGSYDSLSPV